MLIRNAEIFAIGVADLRVTEGGIAAIGALRPQEGEQIVDAQGGALIPGLHDHHIHLAALAAKASSVCVGPPEVCDANALRETLSAPGEGWIRGVDYHESVAGLLDAAALDDMAPSRPVRVQHRAGRMWFLNTMALDALLAAAAPPPGLERAHGRFTGRLFDEDAWLKRALRSAPPALADASRRLARFGVTGVTDMSPANDPAMAAHILSEQGRGALQQRCRLAGALSLADVAFSERMTLGPAKLHLHEAALPLQSAAAFVRAAHHQGRAVAMHCVTETELVFALATFDEAGAVQGDRIEHASIAPDHLIAEIARLGLAVVAQPHFIRERGDQYRVDLSADDLKALGRLRAFAQAGVVLAGGSDAPFGSADPWAAMAAAVDRRTLSGRAMGLEEALSPEEALRLFLADPADLARTRAIAVGAPADLCLLDRAWRIARRRLSGDSVRMTLVNGVVVHDRVDEAPAQRYIGADALARQDQEQRPLPADAA